MTITKVDTQSQELMPLKDIKHKTVDLVINESVSNDSKRRSLFIDIKDGVATVGATTFEFKSDEAIPNYIENKSFTNVNCILDHLDHDWSAFELLKRAGVAVDGIEWQSPMGHLSTEVFSRYKDQRQEIARIYDTADNWARSKVKAAHIGESIKNFFIGTEREISVIEISAIDSTTAAFNLYAHNNMGRILTEKNK